MSLRGDVSITSTTVKNSSGLVIELCEGESATIDGCHFEENYGDQFGSSTVQIAFCGSGAPRTFQVLGSTFRNNVSFGPTIGWADVSDPGGLEVLVEGCLFEGDSGPAAGRSEYAVVRGLGDPDAPTVIFRGNTVVRCIDFSLGIPVGLDPDRFRLPINSTITQNTITGGGIGLAVPPPGGALTVSCNLVWGSTDNWGGGPDLTGVDGNLSEPPKYCGAGIGDFRVASNSVLLAANNSCGVQIGAFGQGCDAISVEPATWGSIKALYR